MKDRDKGLDPTPDSNPDPITGEPGAHPVGVAGGSGGGAAAGAAIGAVVGGPVGALVGGAIGAVAGGYAGKGAAEAVNPTEEDAYWKGEYNKRPYYKSGSSYDQYSPAYKYGYESAAKPGHSGRPFNEVESDLEKGWTSARGNAKGEWRDMKDATRDAYDRVRTRMSGTGSMAGGAVAGAAARTANATSNAADYVGDKADSVWEQTKGNWKQLKGSIKEKWNMLTDDDLDRMDGTREKLVGKIQEKYGEAKWKEADIERELRGMRR